MKKLTLITALTALLALPVTAQAKDMTGRTGLGGEASLSGGGGGLSVKHWVSKDFGLQATLNVAMTSSSDEAVVPSTNATHLGIRALFNALQANETNWFAGGGVLLGLTDQANQHTTIELVAGVEHWFNTNFSVSGLVGLPIAMSVDTGVPATGGGTVTQNVIGLGATSWGSAFTFYF